MKTERELLELFNKEALEHWKDYDSIVTVEDSWKHSNAKQFEFPWLEEMEKENISAYYRKRIFEFNLLKHLKKCSSDVSSVSIKSDSVKGEGIQLKLF